MGAKKQLLPANELLFLALNRILMLWCMRLPAALGLERVF